LGKAQRTKGAVGEREVCAILSAALGKKIERNIGQARDGGCDINAGSLVVEVKRRKTLTTFRAWYEQARAAVTRTGDIPIVVMREDGEDFMVALSLTDFLTLTGEKIAAQIV
jgi:Holliday junction resolvase-like predicted endonuclease